MDWTVDSPKRGDIIRTKVSFYYHYGIFVSEAEVIQFGLPDALQKNAKDIVVIVSDVDTFLNGGELETAKPTKDEVKKIRPREQIVEIARGRIGEGGYDILHNNCEHFVNECAFGKSTSFLDNVRERLRKKLKKDVYYRENG